MFGIYTRILRYSKKLKERNQASYFKRKRGSKSFKYNNKFYKYLIHPYNYTWRNERTVEIPIVQKILEENKGKDVLELGNVLVHYINISHDVLDKYEVSLGVINEDVVSFKGGKYDLIISISTLEHVGWDEDEKDVKKVLKAVENLKKHLKKGGKIIITHPLGYNKFMDEYIENGKLKLDKIDLMVRATEDNEWKQTAWKKNLYIRYHYPFPYANGLVIGEIR